MLKNTKTNNIKMSSSCLTRGSSARAHNTKAYHASGCPIGSGMTGESGRSMIEMLGVLAIIGVLSVGGIAGYTSAMNKHRANELLNQVSMRATSVMAQVEFGNTPNVDDFGTYDGYKFTAAANTANANQFTITISEKTVPDAVCKNMKNAVGSSTSIRDINADCTIITYNNDMGTTVYASDFNGNSSACTGASKKWCSGSNTCVESGADCSCSGTAPDCQTCDTTTGSYVADSNQNGDECTPAGGGSGTCNAAGECVATPSCATSGPCTSNEGVCPDYYCHVDGSCDWDTEEYTITAGTITALPSQPISKNSNGYHVGGYMTWDAAYYYCQALKARGDITSGLAGKDNTDLPDDDAYWLNSLYPSGSTPTSSNSCDAFYMDYGDVHSNVRYSDCYALCE